VRQSLPSEPPLTRLGAISRTGLASVPTPLLAAPSLAAHLGACVRISVKADDRTGLGLGGNKVRKLEYELAPERLRGVTELVTSGGPHSNHCRVVAAAAAQLGLRCTLVINGQPEDPTRGNACLHRLLGASIVTVPERQDRDPATEEEARRIGAAGGRALVVPLGASTPRGALGYVHAAVEMHRQLDSRARVWIFVCTSSGGTLGGLILGCALLGWPVRLVGVSADEPAGEAKDKAVGLALDAARLLGGKEVGDSVRTLADSVVTTDDFVGPGYGAATPAGDEAARIFGARTGLILDPVYTAKAAAAMIEWVRQGRVPASDRVVFVHTGGHPALFR